MAKKTVKKATKEPKGIITRDKLKFTAAWKIADADYKDGQQWTRKISYAVATTEASAIGASLTFTEASGDEITEPLGTSVTSRVIKIEADDYYPNSNKRLKKVSVKVKGKRKGHENSKTKYVYTWSKWSEFVFAINAPKNPTFSAKPAALYQDDDRRSHFIVSATSVDDKNHNPVSRLQWESILVKNASTTDGSKQKWDRTVTGWRTGTTNTLSNYEVPIPTETIVPTDTDSWTRFVRVRAQGIGGDSAWVYNYHVYGKAYVPQVTEGDVGVGDGTLIIDADWATPSDPSHPVDRITLQYCITEPAAGLTCPASASWTDAQVTGDTKAIDKAFYEVGQGLEDDQCLFYRVTAVHDNETTHSDPVLKYVGYLKQPTGLSVQINWQTKRATVTATNASGVADSFLAIYTNIGGYHCIGYIPHGQTSVTVEIPDFANESNFAIGVRAVVGMWQNGLKPYEGKPLMESEYTLWQGGSVPKAPTNVTVEKTSVSGTVSVSWDWAWEDADSAQIAWSDNPLAWESTDEPSDYTITNLNPSRWYVAELATGQTWYFRVRLLQTNDDSITYGAWSDMASINLSSAPNRPTLFLSDGVISADSMTKAYWAYVSTDTTPQAYAEICEATIDGGGITYGDPILHTQSEQHIDIYPDELGWAEGETHYLCVRVTSASGIPSEGWSEPVPLQIAAGMTCSITEDSLETQSIEVNPETHSGNPITFTNPDGVLEFAKLRVDLEPTQDGTGDPSPSNVRPIHGVGEVVVTDTNGEDTQTFTQTLTTTLQPIASDDEPYLMRAMPYDDATNLTESLVGGTLAWNQLEKHNRASGTQVGVTFTNNGNGTFTLNGTATVATHVDPTNLSASTPVVNNHVYLGVSNIPNPSSGGISLGVYVGGAVKYLPYKSYLFYKPTSESGAIQTGFRIASGYTVTNLTVTASLFDLTAMFGTTIADAIYAMEQATTGTGVAWFKKLFPKSYYPYDAGSLQSVKPSAHVMKDADENVIGNYPLPPVELRGIPKWVNGKLSYDGDILEPSGRLTRKYGVVDLGTLTWSARESGDSSKTRFVAYLGTPKAKPSISTNVTSMCKFEVLASGGTFTGEKDGYTITESGDMWVYLDAHKTSTAEQFKTAMSGVYLVYELATATTETVSSFEANQLASAGGTESYTDTRTVPIPVGHKSTYKTSHVYGGYVDLVSGELVVDRAVVDLGTVTWYYVSAQDCFYTYGFREYTKSAPKLVCSSYPYVGIYADLVDKSCGYIYGNATCIRDSSFNQDTTAFKTAMNGVTLVYELANPITYTLTSRELSALVGRNTLTANGNMQIRLAEGITETECLTRLPLTVTVIGAGDGGTTILAIERDGDYLMRRPDETEYTGHDGETIALLTQSGEDEMTVDLPSLIGYLDDGARYRIVATTKDAFGQSATDSIDFLVKWDEQAIVPDGVVEIDGTIAKLTPIAPSGVTDGAVCDVYRLSADRPELVYPNAEFGETYVDPYPAIGGGYRFVYKTKYGDYIDENDALAWLDVESEFEHDRMIVNFGGDSVELYYNIDEDDDWSKDFQATQYLGGHIVGDWNPAVERTADISAVVITIIEEDTVDALRRLADYAGAVHVRTLSGSSYTANVDVKRTKSHDHYGTRYSYGLKISKVDSQGYDGMPEDLYEVIS